MLELNGAYEISFGKEHPVDPIGAETLHVAGFTYEIDLNKGTYTLTEIDPLDVVAGLIGFSSQEREPPILYTGMANPRGGNPGVDAASTGMTDINAASEAGNCGNLWRIHLWVKTRTEDPLGINLAETEQTAIWNSNYCQNRLIGVSRRHWANPSTIFFDTYWFVIDSGSSQSPRTTFYPWTWADTYGYYQNDNFGVDSQSTWASHTIDFTLFRNIAYSNYRIVHTGYYQFFLSGDILDNFYFYRL